jgi:formylglycine-generating enzyme required for sulfatase activity
VQIASSARKIIAPLIVRGAAPGADLRYYIGVRHQVTWTDAAPIAATLTATFGKGAPIPPAPKARYTPGDVFRDGADMPEMVVIPSGRFLMGPEDKPQREVRIERAFALGKYPVTFEEWDAANLAGAKLYKPYDEG